MRRPALLLALAGLALARGADADEATRACTTADENAQLRMNEGKLAAARGELRTCVAETCHPLVRGECQKLLESVEAAQPTVVVSVEQASGGDVVDASLRLDDETTARALDGRPRGLDPGRHTLTVTAAGFEDAAQTLMVRSGEKNRVVRFVLAARPRPPTPSAVAARSREEPVRPSTPSWTLPRWIVAGAGAAALGVAGYFYIAGFAKDRGLRRDCAPHCSSSDIDQVRYRFIAGDVALALSALAFSAVAVVRW